MVFPDVFRVFPIWMMGSAVMPAPMTWKAKALSGHHIGATQVAAVGAFTDQVVFPWASENS